jgi:Family of unknown function (DUF5681)
MANPNPNPATRFKPGDDWTGNPGGRPRERTLSCTLRKLLSAPADELSVDLPDDSLGTRLAKVLLRGALAGDFRAWKEVVDRTEGRVADRMPPIDEIALMTDEELIAAIYTERSENGSHEPPIESPQEQVQNRSY